LLAILLFKALPVYAGVITVFIDIKPNSCPNPLSCRAGGLISVAILGTETLNVEDINPASVELLGVPATRSDIEDVSQPFTDELSTCFDCNEAGADGFDDLVLKFDKRAVLTALGSAGVSDGNCIRRSDILTGELFDGTFIEGEDSILIRCKNR